MQLKEKNKKDEFVDDGRVIANMNIDGMPRSTIRRMAFDEFGKKKKNEDPIPLSRKDRWSIFFGVATSYILFIVIVFGAFTLFILFCTKVWFK